MPQRRPLLKFAGTSATLAALSALAGLGTARGAWAQTLPQPLPGSLTAHNPTTHNLTEREFAALNNLSPEGVRVDFPRLADTGAAVPLEAELQAPAGTRIARIDVYLPLNPNTHALKMSFPEPVPAYRFATRLRLAHTQDAWVVMTLTDGSRRGASAPTIITSSSCFDES